LLLPLLATLKRLPLIAIFDTPLRHIFAFAASARPFSIRYAASCQPPLMLTLLRFAPDFIFRRFAAIFASYASYQLPLRHFAMMPLSLIAGYGHCHIFAAEPADSRDFRRCFHFRLFSMPADIASCYFIIFAADLLPAATLPRFRRCADTPAPFFRHYAMR
jgi:hypothetical protein